MNATHEVDATAIFGPQRDSLYIVLPITIIYSVIFVTGLLGNIFTCLVIVRNKSMHTATNYYLFSLAISDLLLLVSGMPQEIYSIWSKWPYIFGYSFCVIRGLAAETSTNASVLTITLFTIERYLAICHPFVSHQMSKLSRAMKHVVLLWLVALGLALPQALQFGIRSHKGVIMCLQTHVIIEHSFEISTFVFFFAPMVLISVLYLLIGMKLRETSNSKEESQNDFERSIRYTHQLRRKHSQSTKRVIKMLVAVVVAFFICWAPFHAQRLVAIYGTTEEHLARSPILLAVYSSLTYISGVFYYLSTCINPIFYHIMSNKFREAFKNTMKSQCCRGESQVTGKRCSYTAMPFPKHPTSSGGTNNSGNSLKNETACQYKARRQGSMEKNNYSQNVQGDQHVKKPLRTPAINEPIECNHKLSFDHFMASEQQELLRKINETPAETFVDLVDTKRNPPEILSSTKQSSPKDVKCGDAFDETIPDKKEYLIDEPENYLKEIKLRFTQRDKEYG